MIDHILPTVLAFIYSATFADIIINTIREIAMGQSERRSTNCGVNSAHGMNGWPWTMVAKVLLVCVVSVFSLGCPATYQPDDKLVRELGVERAKQRLKDTLVRSINPQMVEVEVTDDYFSYRFRQAIAGFQTGAILDNRVFFLNTGRVDVHANNVVNVFTPAQQLLAQLIFASYEDAKTVGDLITSLRARKASGTR
jgi:hypothetical protein